MKQLLVITRPTFVSREAELIGEMLEAGVARVHIRKPQAEKDEIRSLLTQIPESFHPRLSLHDAFDLVGEFPHLGGLHLNRRNQEVPTGFQGLISRSCHTFGEIEACRQLDYLFLSPIFNSISKEGYNGNFTVDSLKEASARGLINRKVFALGGISAETIPDIQEVGFGGVAVLGSVWKTNAIKEVRNLLHLLNS